MTAKALVWDGSFGDPTLPKIALGYTPPLPESIYCWTAENLPLGPLTQWTSGIDGRPLVADAGIPTVVNSGGGRAVRFDGVDDRMRATFTITTSRTFVAVYRFTNPQAGDTVFYGRSNDSGGALLVNSGGTYMAARAGTDFMRTDPDIVPDDQWHVAILGIISDSAVLRHDNDEVFGDLPRNTVSGLALGFNPYNTAGRTAVEYKHMEVLEGGLSIQKRDAIVNLLAARYGIDL